MRTRSQTRNLNRQQQAPPAVVEPFNLEEPFDNPPLVPMADNRTMAELLQAPTEGYEDAIVIPEINANFELKHGLINLVQNKQFFGHDKEDPHAHIRYFNKITSTMRFSDVPSTSIKLMIFPFSLKDTFYNALNANDQDSLNSAAGGNYKAVVAKVSTSSSTPGISPDVAALTTEVSELKNMMRTMIIDKALVDLVRIKQKSQENGQNQTNTDTGTEEHTKSRENAIKSQQWSTQVRGTVAVRGGSTRQYEVLFRWRLDQLDGDTWHWRVSVRGTVAVSTR
ncbi:hypothetical protein Tco_0387302 [Tanacetum coccineum]